MSIASEITRINTNIANAYNEAEAKGATLPVNQNSDNLPSTIATITGGGGSPPTSTGGIFTGATIPLNYYGNTNVKEYTQYYKSSSHNITITGLDSEATITGNGTKAVTVEFSTTSTTTHLTEFTITLEKDLKTTTYKGLYAYYGTNVTGCLTLAYTNIPRTGTGTIGTEYKFIETTATDLPYFSSDTTRWNTIYQYQVLNTLVGNITSIGTSFLRYCYSFNQPLDISNVTSIGIGFLYNCYSFNQPLNISNITSIGAGFLGSCYSFNQPLDISNVTSIGINFLNSCYSFNQPLDISNITSIGTSFLYNCYSFNQPLDISNITSIGDSFLYNCYSFNQPLDISNITSIGDSFLGSCYSLSTIIYNAIVYPTDGQSLSQNQNSKTSTNGAGILVYGTQRAGLLTALINRTSNPYRKLIDGGAD